MQIAVAQRPLRSIVDGGHVTFLSHGAGQQDAGRFHQLVFRNDETRHGFPAAVSFCELEGQDGFVVSTDFAPVRDLSCVDIVQLLQRKIFHGIVRAYTENEGFVEDGVASQRDPLTGSEAGDRFGREEAEREIGAMIDFYNNVRPHMSIGNKKPMDVYNGEVPGKNLWKKDR